MNVPRNSYTPKKLAGTIRGIVGDVTVATAGPAQPRRARGEYRKSAQRREQIIDAAFVVFSRVGYLNATMTEIAGRAAITVPGLTHHFPTKSDLLAGVFDRRDLDAATHLEGRSGVELLRGLVEIARRDETDLALTRMYAILTSEATDPGHPAHAYFGRRYDFILSSVEQAFREAEATNDLREGVEPREAARAYVALSDGLQLQRLYNPTGALQSTLIEKIIGSFLVTPL